MEIKMSIRSRKEILCYTKKRYLVASSKEKSKILDEFVSVTGYLLKYAIHILNLKSTPLLSAIVLLKKKCRVIYHI